eukprot:CAMPEP_0194278814 /NCGR_PEP_ID=MMETSP0169-20130528/12263_1 /TAXON_ID=218684 /ORGANISM="Corethron pennatum, Strain L29A3" /LENGTH=934 /DNA_ID=CAMNT_0039023091 /DNA_START=167 /DNA_END=2971 /DNA_ORIENTATION=-
MAPREAHGTHFSEHLFTLDYDSGGAVPPPTAIPHDTTPNSGDDEDDDDFIPGGATQTPAANVANANAGPSSEAGRGSGEPPTGPLNVDPLSVDPSSHSPGVRMRDYVGEDDVTVHLGNRQRRVPRAVAAIVPPSPPPSTRRRPSSSGGDPPSPSSSIPELDTTGSDGDASSVGELEDSLENSAEDMSSEGDASAASGASSAADGRARASLPTLQFSASTTLSDLRYFAERGLVVPALAGLDTPRLLALGSRMIADYAKSPARRVAVASNASVLRFLMAVIREGDAQGREYSVEAIRSLTATEESDQYLMQTPNLLSTLAGVAADRSNPGHGSDSRGSKARLHACIAIMNLSCGKSNKVEIARIPEVLLAMRDVMMDSVMTEARLKATTCIKNLSNADANDAALLGTSGLVEALGHVTAISGDSAITTNACLALMNLSISKQNKHRVFCTPGVMDALMSTAMNANGEARVKACSALSNLAIGYDNKIPMFEYPGFVEVIISVIGTDGDEARTKACSILWSFAAEMKNQIPVVSRGDILPVLVRVAREDVQTEARFKCVAALTLLAESLDNAVPILSSGALVPLMDILEEAGPDPTQWKGQTASWCVGFLMNMAQSDDAVRPLREAGVVELLTPLLTLDHYQSLKAAMAVTFVCRYDECDEAYDLLRKTESVIPKIITLLHNTLSGKGGNGYKYGVFTLRSSVGCIQSLAAGPDFMKERMATGPVFESLLRVLNDFCVECTPGAIVGGGKDDGVSPTLAVRAVHSLTTFLIPAPGNSLPFGPIFDGHLVTALKNFETNRHPELKHADKLLARETWHLIQGLDNDTTIKMSLQTSEGSVDLSENDNMDYPVRTFLLEDKRGRRFCVPVDPSGKRNFYDNRQWCFRRGRFCKVGETPDPAFRWSRELQLVYLTALATQQLPGDSRPGDEEMTSPMADS